jgi:hypothetical protein
MPRYPWNFDGYERKSDNVEADRSTADVRLPARCATATIAAIVTAAPA